MSKLDNIDPTTLAHNPRASLPEWLRYQHIVEAAYYKHPNPHIFTPSNLRVSTCVSRIRDAIKGCITFEYPCIVPYADLQRWFNETVFTPCGTEVRIGPRLQRSERVETVAKSDGYVFTTLEPEEFQAFAFLLSRGRLQGPVKVLKAPDWSSVYPNLQTLRTPDGALVLI